MPFNKNNAVNYGSKGGKVTKPPGTVRNKKLLVTLTEAEFDEVTEKAKALKLSKAELVVRAVKEYDEE
jgi:hypothetical protein